MMVQDNGGILQKCLFTSQIQSWMKLIWNFRENHEDDKMALDLYIPWNEWDMHHLDLLARCTLNIYTYGYNEVWKFPSWLEAWNNIYGTNPKFSSTNPYENSFKYTSDHLVQFASTSRLHFLRLIKIPCIVHYQQEEEGQQQQKPLTKFFNSWERERELKYVKRIQFLLLFFVGHK